MHKKDVRFSLTGSVATFALILVSLQCSAQALSPDPIAELKSLKQLSTELPERGRIADLAVAGSTSAWTVIR